MSQVTTASGLIIEDLVVGEGAEAAAGQHVTCITRAG
jgi:FKBP-type peptidyl-prolyl cis-trans isomerase